MVSGRELFICENFIDADMGRQIAAFAGGLQFERKERARKEHPPSADSAELPETLAGAAGFLTHLKQIAEEMFPGERLHYQRAYVNSSVYGDFYSVHRDCAPSLHHVTVLYYVNLEWQPDWGGETVFYNDNYDAEVVVSPRAGRVVVARGAILHRGNVPTLACTEKRLTIAYKLFRE
jgi:SM-20-related protein